MSVVSPVSYPEALTIIGGLSHTEKMPWWSWSISARDCITGSKLAQAEGTVCSGCYALKGRYLFPNVRGAHDRRLRATEDPRFEDAFVVVLENLFAKTRKRGPDGEVENRFRWFDSGDLQSVDMLITINNIARRTPHIRHWLPTREIRIVEKFLQKHELCDNLTLRVSLPKVGVAPAKAPLGLPMAAVEVRDRQDFSVCPAREFQGNRCLDCDVCWSKRHVSYPLH